MKRRNQFILLAFAGIAAVYLVAFFWQTERLRGLRPNDQIEDSPRFESFTLENGLRVVMIQMPKAEKSALMVWYGVGAADDPTDSPGLAHYLEHATFSILQQHAEDDTAGSRESQLAIPEAFTSFDFTGYYYLLSKADLGRALQLEATRMSALTFSASAIEAERDAIEDERIQQVDDNPHAFLEEELQRAAYGTGPYSKPIVPDVGAAPPVSPEALQDFWARWYGPNNAVLVMAGPLEIDVVRRLVDTAFSGVDRKSIGSRERPPAPIASGGRLEARTDQQTAPLWARMYVTPPKADRRTILALILAGRILADDGKGRLYRALVEKGLAQAVSIEYAPDGLANLPFTIHVELADGADMAAVERVVDEELEKLLAGVFPDELAQARRGLNESLQNAWKDPIEAASMVASALITGRTLNDVIETPHIIAAITPTDVRGAVAKLFTRGAGVTGTAISSKR